jgi:hypothetical protein
MGLLDRFRPAKIEAQLAPPLMTDSFNYFLPLAFNPVGREEAISVPSVARCRNLTCRNDRHVSALFIQAQHR